jgi:hypothetical protein
MIRDHLRSNVVGYLALFVALSGTAIALPATGTVFSDDIVNGEVKTKDISDTNGVRSADVRDDDLNGGGLAAVDLARESVARAEIATGGVGVNEIATNAVRAEEIGTDSVGKDAIVTDGVGANELDEVHEHESEEQTITDGTAHDGAYGIDTVTVACLFASEDLLSVSIDWTDTNDHSERVLSEVKIERSGTDSATVQAAFDGGGGAGNPARYKAFATCLQS